jgi:tetratricopeptide (TPR) repeat protein
MEYRGNSALPKEIKDRILTTFQQTLQSARDGNYQEAMLGCDFILRLDPDFQPAQQLTERLKQVAGDQVASAGPEVPPPAPAPAAPPAEPATDPGPAMRQFLESRQLKPLMELADKHRDAVLGDPELRGMVELAQSRLQAEPHLQKLVESGRQLLENGQLDEVDGLLEQGRALDATYPPLVELAALRQAMTAPQQENAGADTGPIDPGVLESSLEPSLEEDPFSFGEDPLGASLDLGADPFSLDEKESAGGLDDDDPFSLGDKDALEAGDSLADPFSLDEDDASFPAAEDTADPFAFGEDDAGDANDAGDAADALGAGFDAGLEAGDSLADPFSLDADDEPASTTAAAGSADSFALDQEDDSTTDFGGSAGGEDSDSRIGELLTEGQSLFDGEDYQGAIDAWSRIFLIDIDHREATQRIEKARSLKAEQERQVEEVFHEGLEQLKARDVEAAQGSFRRVLALQPGHGAAQEYLQQLEAGEVPELTGIVSPPMGGMRSDTSSVPTPEEISGDTADPGMHSEELKEEILVPPDPSDLSEGAFGSGALAGDKPPTQGGTSGARRKFVMIGSGVLVVVTLLGGYIWLNRDKWFPNSTAPPPPSQPLARPKNPIEEAQRLRDEGKGDQALRQLRLLPQDSAYFEEAQKLIAELAGETESGPVLPPEEAALRDQLLAEGEQYFAAGEMLRTQEVLIAAGEMAPLEGEAAERMDQVQQRLAPLQSDIVLVREGEWELALKNLWRMQIEDPENRDVVRLLTDCYFNLGVQALQRGNVAQAEGRFGEVLQLQPDDIEAQRHFRFAQAYQEQPQDLLFRIYVKYLPFR